MLAMPTGLAMFNFWLSLRSIAVEIGLFLGIGRFLVVVRCDSLLVGCRFRVSYALRQVVICDSCRLSNGAKRWH